MSKYYAVACGRQVGIFQTWTEAEKQVRGFPGAKHKRFDTEEEAKLYLENPVTKRKINTDRPPQKKQKTSPLESSHRRVWTDGSCVGPHEQRTSGWSVYMEQDKKVYYGSLMGGIQTNQRAELFAIVKSLELIWKYERNASNDLWLVLHDSMYAVDCFTRFLPGWIQNNFQTIKGEPVKHQDLIKEGHELLIKLEKACVTIKFQHVKAHSGVQGNEIVDTYAKMGATANPKVEEIVQVI